MQEIKSYRIFLFSHSYKKNHLGRHYLKLQNSELFLCTQLEINMEVEMRNYTVEHIGRVVLCFCVLFFYTTEF